MAADARGQPILDVGVGTGRTTSLLRLLSADYVGVDYTPEMVRVCRALHPDADIRHVDARDLSMFDAGRFQLVVFIMNGFDAVPHDDRAVVLAELWRVLRPGGHVVLSTHNKRSPTYRSPPWRVAPARPRRLRRLARFLVGLPRSAAETALTYRNWLRNRRLAADHGDWGMAVCESHRFGIVIHFTTLAAHIGELRTAGFDDVEVYGREDGALIKDAEAGGDYDGPFFYVVARKPEA